MQKPLVSILLCTYNGELFLKEQLDSLIAQTYQNIEIIVSDDASADSTREILLQYGKLNNVKLFFRKDNIGCTKNFEFAAQHATGKYIAFADQDDVWINNKIEKLVNAIGNHSLVYSDSIFIDASGNETGDCFSDFRLMKNIYDARELIFTNSIPGHSMLVKRELVMNALPFPDNYFYDHWLAVQAANRNGICFIADKLTLYRRHDNNVTQIAKCKRNKALAKRNKLKDYEATLAWIELLKNYSNKNNESFFQRLYSLFSLRKTKAFVWPLFYFLLRYQRNVFALSTKKFVSKFFRIRLLSRGIMLTNFNT